MPESSVAKPKNNLVRLLYGIVSRFVIQEYQQR
jgi:hypothetical protein